MKNLNGFFPALKVIVKSFVLLLTKKNILTKALIKIKTEEFTKTLLIYLVCIGLSHEKWPSSGSTLIPIGRFYP